MERNGTRMSKVVAARQHRLKHTTNLASSFKNPFKPAQSVSSELHGYRAMQEQRSGVTSSILTIAE